MNVKVNKNKHLLPSALYDKVLNDISRLRSSSSRNNFEKKRDKILMNWSSKRSLNQFKSYFEKQWLSGDLSIGNCSWHLLVNNYVCLVFISFISSHSLPLSHLCVLVLSFSFQGLRWATACLRNITIRSSSFSPTKRSILSFWSWKFSRHKSNTNREGAVVFESDRQRKANDIDNDDNSFVANEMHKVEPILDI